MYIYILYIYIYIIYICKYICIYMRMHMQTHIHIHGTGADSGPGVFNDLYFKHYVWICLKLWRRDDFVILPRIKNVVFVPRYARNLFVDH